MKGLLTALRELQTSAEGLAAAMTQLRAETGPAVVAEGVDRTGSVRVWVDAGGLPDRAEVGAGWRHRLGPSDFADAVTQAGRAAAAAQLRQVREAWTSSPPDLSRWTERRDRLPATTADLPASAAPDASGVAGTVPPEGAAREIGAAEENGAARDLTVLAEEVLALVRRRPSTEQAPGAAERRGTGQAAQGQLGVTVSALGELTCRASSAWVDGQDAAALGSAVDEALAQASAELRGTGLSEQADVLFADLMGLLQRPAWLLPGDHPMRPSTREDQ